ncbi:hypothetical protein C7T35_23895 [Variovorax sp. WS11]|uniref:hypothetical protein n=1 Tax=Variovorax sp. WS11 TaxID=1105204 RepID=UPI000D0DAFE1|nr:hypothetical protein [Variovorax sp. WS11]NDZ11447.1 hypothetical protein [Variovorax sp. WS11]PSL82087.1 hypothetical protein C7T35_23895 [Variovorax sp. WS11]
MGDPLINALATVLESSATLVSLKLDITTDWAFEDLTEAMEHNHSLRTLSNPRLETLRSTNPDDFGGLYPHYVALTNCVERNRREWERWENSAPFIEGGMRVILGRMAASQLPKYAISVERVHNDIAGYATQIAKKMIGKDAMAVTLLNKLAHEEGMRVLKPKNEPEKTQPDAS